MELGVCVATHIGDIDYVVRAEALGYSHAWLADFVTPELIDSTCLVGTADDLVRRLAAFAAAGLDQVMILPAFAPRYAVLERVGKEVLPRIA